MKPARDSRLWRAGEIARLCVEAGAPALMPRFLDSGLGIVQVAEKLQVYAAIQAEVTAAAKINLVVDPKIALDMFERGLDVAAARAALAALPQVARPKEQRSVWQRASAADPHGWRAAISKGTGRVAVEDEGDE